MPKRSTGRNLKRWLLALVAIAACALLVSSALARAAYDSPYGFDRTWTAAIRLVRVDLQLKITEKDESSGYLLFEYRSPESQKSSSGSIEVIRGKDNEPVHVVAQLPEMPRYHEQVLVDSLMRKLQREYGDAPQRRAADPKRKVPDAGTEDAGE